MSETMLEKAARALYEFGMMADCPKWDQLEQRYRQDFYDMARAVLMAVRELPADFTRERRAQFYNAEFLDADFESVIDAILAQEPGA